MVGLCKLSGENRAVLLSNNTLEYITPEFIVRCVSHARIIQGGGFKNPSISIDSRTCISQDIFFALSGVRADGHDFLDQVCTQNVQGIIIKESKLSVISATLKKFKGVIITVPDPYTALCELAIAWRLQFTGQVVGITGSVGKTSTHRYICTLLDRAHISYAASEGNYNTRLGAAISVLSLRNNHQVGVFEMGISTAGEMVDIAEIVRPTIAVITTIAPCHLEGLKTVQNIVREKLKIVAYSAPGSPVVLGNSSILKNYLVKNPAVLDQFSIIWSTKKRVGRGHQGIANNKSIAAAVGRILNISATVINAMLEENIIISHRYELKKLINNKGVLIDDCYNANPVSMRVALNTFDRHPGEGKKVAIIGDMRELGSRSAVWHRKLGFFLKQTSSIEKIILVGDQVGYMVPMVPPTIQVAHVITWQEAIPVLNNILSQEILVTILVKGSRGVALDKLVSQFVEPA